MFLALIQQLDTYIIEVRARKSTQEDGDDVNTTFGDEGDPSNVQDSEASQLDLVGPQTLTAENMYPLTVAVAYSSAVSGDDTKLDDPVVDASDTDNIKLNFNPLAETEADSPVTVTLTQADGSHTFPVEILAASAAPTVSRIPSQELVQQPRAQTVDLSRYFQGDNLTFTITSQPNPNVAIANIVGSKLEITTRREGRTIITVTARDEDTRGTTSQEIRVTVIAPNNPPQLAGNIPDLTLYLDDAGTQVDMAQYFRDQDNEFLRFIPQSSNPMVVTATSVGRNVIFNVNSLGQITMTIIAQDGAGATAFGSFTVNVLDPNAAPQAVGVIPPQDDSSGRRGVGPESGILLHGRQQRPADVQGGVG